MSGMSQSTRPVWCTMARLSFTEMKPSLPLSALKPTTGWGVNTTDLASLEVSRDVTARDSKCLDEEF